MWYYALGPDEFGPVSESEMQTLIANGTVTGTTQVWKDGMGEWGPASTIPGLIPSSSVDVVRDEAAPLDASNPYAQSGEIGSTSDYAPAPAVQYDTFTKVMLIVDVVLCGLQTVSLILTGLMFVLMRNAPRMTVGTLSVVNTGLLVLVLIAAFTADTMLLLRKKGGVSIAWIAAGLTAVNIVIHVVDTIMTMSSPEFANQLQQQGQGPPGMTDTVVGLTVGLTACWGLVRVGVLICYTVAIKRASLMLGAKR